MSSPKKRIQQVYMNKRNNYKNIEEFSTIFIPPNTLETFQEGVITKTKQDTLFKNPKKVNSSNNGIENDIFNAVDDVVNTANQVGTAYENAWLEIFPPESSINKKTSNKNKPVSNDGKAALKEASRGISDEQKKLLGLWKSEQKKSLDQNEKTMDELTKTSKKFISEFSNTKQASKDTSNTLKDITGGKLSDITKKETKLEKKSIITKIIVFVLKVFFFITGFFYNILLYLSIASCQIIYGEAPFYPFVDLTELEDPNWPWVPKQKFYLKVSRNDNFLLNKNAKLIKTTDLADTKYQINQKILHDANVVFNIVSQFILVILAWVATNNFYYYIFIDKTPFPYTLIKPEDPINPNTKVVDPKGKKIVKNKMFVYAIVNTLCASPFDVILYLFGFKWLTIPLFAPVLNFFKGFRELAFIIMFLITLSLFFVGFWEAYTYLNVNLFKDNMPILWDFNPLFFIFIFYGMFFHYFRVDIIKNNGRQMSNIGKIIWGLIIITIFIAIYPIIRFFVFFWAIYIFFGYQGFTSATFDDIKHHTLKEDCNLKVSGFYKFIRNAFQFCFPYFFYFVMFVLILSNLNFLNDVTNTQNSDTSSIMKIIITFIFLFIFAYLVYSLINKYTPNPSRTIYTDKEILKQGISDPFKLLAANADNNAVVPGLKTPIPGSDPNAPPGTTTPGSDPNAPPGTTAPGLDPNAPPGTTAPGLDPNAPPGTTAPVSDPNAPPGTTSSDPNAPPGTTTTVSDPNAPPNPNAPPGTVVDGKKQTIIEMSRSTLKSFRKILDKFQLYGIPGAEKIEKSIIKLELILNDPIVDIMVATPFELETFLTKVKERVNSPDFNLPGDIKRYILNTIEVFKRVKELRMENQLVIFINEILKLDPLSLIGLGGIIPIAKNEDPEFVKFRDALANIIRDVYKEEVNLLISLVQIYNTKQYKPLFITLQPAAPFELMASIVSKIFPDETKGGMIRSVGSALGAAWNSGKLASGFGSVAN